MSWALSIALLTKDIQSNTGPHLSPLGSVESQSAVSSVDSCRAKPCTSLKVFER